MKFTNRYAEMDRLGIRLNESESSFIAIYGRRRLGKSTLVKRVLRDKDIYFMADKSEQANQRKLLSISISVIYPDFDAVTYPNWETLFNAFNLRCEKGTALCLDEFPYLVKSDETLPSVLQKLLDQKTLKFHLILCGSSQQMMFDSILDEKSPLYGRAHELLRLKPISPAYMPDALHISATDAITEYSIWGGVPRYWELREKEKNLEQAIKTLALSPYGVLYDEPTHILRDDMRDIVQASTLLHIIGNGANKISEIAARAEKEASTISAPLQKLVKMHLIEREIPFGESVKSSKHGIYHIADPFMDFHYKFVNTYRSLLELGRIDFVYNIIKNRLPDIVSFHWEKLCRKAVSGQIIDGIPFGAASRWWGKISKNESIEIDVVSESLDHKTLLVGECKWTKGENAEKLLTDLTEKASKLPFTPKYKRIIPVVFLRHRQDGDGNGIVFQPQDVLEMLKEDV